MGHCSCPWDPKRDIFDSTKIYYLLWTVQSVSQADSTYGYTHIEVECVVFDMIGGKM
eukprot:SAG31_NODE_1142_length_9696_cov_3.874232_14_plen_57_part_00